MTRIMKRILPLIILIGGVGLFAMAFMFYQKSESLKKETEILRELTEPTTDHNVDEPYEPTPEPEYDPTDIDQTPPGVTPFLSHNECMFHWGTHMRQYCDGGDNAALELIEGGDDQAETLRTLKMCLNTLLHGIDSYSDRDMRPMDSLIPLDEVNRKALACKMTEKYGNSPAFADGSIYYMTKEHMESGNISRLENR